MAKPKPLWDATISYRTPSGRRVLFGAMVAADSMADCEVELRARLAGESAYGRRKIAAILDDFSARFITMQIGKDS